jgi:hypothetical protein
MTQNETARDFLSLDKNACRPRAHVAVAKHYYPDAWQLADKFRAGRGTHYPDWPNWCFLPIAAGLGIIAEDAGIDLMELPRLYPMRVTDAARLTALATWRVTQGIYRFDPAVYEAVRGTPLTGDIPDEVLYRLPEWCVYVETPGLSGQHGFFAHLEHDHSGRPELRLLLDTDEMLVPVPIHLGKLSLAHAVASAEHEALQQAQQWGLPFHLEQLRPNEARGWAAELAPMVNLLLYVCTQASEISNGNRRPALPVPKQTRHHGKRFFPPDSPTTWDVGIRIGNALRAALKNGQTGVTHPHAGPRAHIRRAHWHGYWCGRDETRRFELRWMPPIAHRGQCARQRRTAGSSAARGLTALQVADLPRSSLIAPFMHDVSAAHRPALRH